MQNLAGNKYATEIVSSELRRCGIEIVNLGADRLGEVPSTVMGKLTCELGEFTFKRAWYYYIVEGRVTLKIANKLYDNPVGKNDIRVNGNCTCPSPEDQATYYDYMGKELVSKEDIEELNKFLLNTTIESTRQFCKKTLPKLKCIDEVPPDSRYGYIDLYHIDSELGLYIFVQTLKETKSLECFPCQIV